MMTIPQAARGTSPALTDREQMVLAHLACGHSNADIGHETGLSEETVKSHARTLYRKLGARDRAHAVALGYQRGLLDGHRRDPVTVPAMVVVPRAEAAAYPRPADGVAFARAVGYVLRTERQRRQWTLAYMGQQVGLSVSVLCRVELGARSLDMTRLLGLCAVLGVAPARVIAVAQAEAFPLGWPD
jgi:DNA-binding CsgD family transcriptional regulator